MMRTEENVMAERIAATASIFRFENVLDFTFAVQVGLLPIEGARLTEH